MISYQIIGTASFTTYLGPQPNRYNCSLIICLPRWRWRRTKNSKSGSARTCSNGVMAIMGTKKRIAVYGLYVCKMRKYIEEESAIIVLHAFITSILDNCNSPLYGLPQHLLSKLQSLFKIQQLELLHVQGNLIAWPLSYKKLHWLPVRHCMVYKILSLLYKAINGTVPCHICDLFDYRNSKGTLRSSSQYPLATPKARL